MNDDGDGGGERTPKRRLQRFSLRDMPEINNIEDGVPERAMGPERPVIEVGRPKADGSMAVDVVAGAEVRLCAPRVVLLVRNPPPNAPKLAP